MRGEAVTGADHLHPGPGLAGARGPRRRPPRRRPARRPGSGSADSSPDQLRQVVTERPRRRRRPAVDGGAWPRRRGEQSERGQGGREAGGERDEVGRGGARVVDDEPAIAAPGATPATSPVCMIAMPSVSRESGTVTCSMSDSGGDHRRRDRDAADAACRAPISQMESTKPSGAIAHAMPSAPQRTRTRGARRHESPLPETTPGEEAAERPERQQSAGGGLRALLVGEGHGGDLGGAEQDAERDADDGRRARACARGAGSRTPAAVRAGGPAARCRAGPRRPGRRPGRRRSRRRDAGGRVDRWWRAR